MRGAAKSLLRIFIALLVLGAAQPIDAQPAGKVARIGVVFTAVPIQEVRESPIISARTSGFTEGLRRLGWVEGKNLEIHWRSAEGRRERIAGLIEELVRLPVDAMLISGTQSAREALVVTKGIPIVVVNAFAPVEAGLAASLSRPGGNVTGLLHAVDADLFGKQLSLLKEIAPNVRRIAILESALLDPSLAGSEHAELSYAAQLGVTLIRVNAENPEQLESAFADAVRNGAGAMFVGSSLAYVAGNHPTFHRLAIRYRLPVQYSTASAVESGGLMSYAIDARAQYFQAARYVDRILRGAKAGDLPMEQPAKFELIVNLKAARAIGLTIPPSLLAQADRVIE